MNNAKQFTYTQPAAFSKFDSGLPFKTIIPNVVAIARAIQDNRNPKSFTAKYSSEFSRLYKNLCSEIESRFKQK